MDELVTLFESHRPHLRAVAQRVLGSRAEAEDAVQDAYLRASRAGLDGVLNPGGWLTTIVARVSLNMLESRKTRREDPLDAPRHAAGPDPAESAVHEDQVGRALTVVLDTLAPAERVAFVLHDLFAVPFGDIAPIVDRAPAATRKLASRARQRVQSAGLPEGDVSARRDLVNAFLIAARAGEFEKLLSMLDPDVVLTADTAAALTGAPAELRGAHAVATRFNGGAHTAFLSMIEGTPGAAWWHRGGPRVAFEFTVLNGRITAVDLIGDLTDVDVERLRPS